MGWETEACLPVSSTGVETDTAAAEVTRRTRTEGTKRRRFRCDGGMAAAVDLGILDGEAGDGRGFRERKEREVALKRRGVVPNSAAGVAVSCPSGCSGGESGLAGQAAP